MRRLAVLLPLVALAGCARDNPDNTPQLGKWEISTKVTSLSVGGRLLAGDRLPEEFRRLEQTESRCGEPMFSDRDWQEDDIADQVNGDCTLDTFDWTVAQVRASGRCTDVRGAPDFTPALRISVDQTADYYRMTVMLEGAATIAGAQDRPMVSVIAVQEGRRTGDC